MMRSFKQIICVFLAMLILLSGCAQKNTTKEELDEARTEELLPLAQTFTSYLQSEDYESAFGMMDDRLWCGYFDGNEKSKRVQEKCGFHYHHTAYNVPCAIEGVLRTEHITCLSKEEWQSVR